MTSDELTVDVRCTAHPAYWGGLLPRLRRAHPDLRLTSFGSSACACRTRRCATGTFGSVPSEFEEVVFIPAKPAELDPFDVLRAVEAECDSRVKDEKRASGVQEYARSVTVFFEGGTCTERTVAEASAEMAKIHAKPRFYVYGLRQFGGVLVIDAVYWVNRAEPGVEVTVKGIDRPVVYGMARTLSEAAKHASPSHLPLSRRHLPRKPSHRQHRRQRPHR